MNIKTYIFLVLLSWTGASAQISPALSAPADSLRRLKGTLPMNATAQTYMQIVNYSWHIRGGLLGINLNGSASPVPNSSEKDLFSYKLEYETAGQWSGNIGKQSWNHVNGTTPVGIRNYTFTYDGLSRLKTAAYSGLGSESYGIPNINYDRNGNITQLQRNGKTGGSFGLMDNLTYTYTGNRLTAVNDAVSGSYEVDFVKRGSGGYTYQVNGALKTDENEEITNIVYNTYLNLPEEITLTGGRWIRYTYDGEGKLLKTEYSTGEYWEYVDEFVFKNGQPYQAAIPDGRVTYASGNWVKEFDYKDHLGNTRASFKEGATGAELTARTDFDPWGVRLNGTGTMNAVQNRWEMQGHEKEATFNLNRINFGARVYNPTIGRFDKPDRYSEKYMPLSTYQYAANDPIRYIDINGDSLWIAFKGNNYLYNNGQLFNSDGSQFEGKMKGFLKQAFNALNEINKVSEGKDVLGDLSMSTNNFYISHASNNPKSTGANQFVDFNRNASYANAMREENQGRPISGGSGGTVYWNPNEGEVTELGGSIGIRPTSNLGHELFHAFDANHGNSDNRASHIQLKRDEVRAAYFENQLRKAFGYPYRESYNTSQFGPVRILDSKNQPINFPK